MPSGNKKAAITVCLGCSLQCASWRTPSPPSCVQGGSAVRARPGPGAGRGGAAGDRWRRQRADPAGHPGAAARAQGVRGGAPLCAQRSAWQVGVIRHLKAGPAHSRPLSGCGGPGRLVCVGRAGPGTRQELWGLLDTRILGELMQCAGRLGAASLAGLLGHCVLLWVLSKAAALSRSLRVLVRVRVSVQRGC